MKHFIFLLLLSSVQVAAQDCLLKGRIMDLNAKKDSLCKIVFIQSGRRLDSSFANSAGNFGAKLPSGHYDIELSKNFCKPVVMRSILLASGEQVTRFHTRFIYERPASRLQYYISQRPAQESELDKHVPIFYIFSPPPPNPIVTVVYLHSDRSDDPDLGLDTSQALDTLAQQQATEIVGNGNWYMRYLPNPANASARFDFSEAADHIRIIDARGKLVFDAYGKSLYFADIDVSAWPKGVYRVYVSRQTQTLTGKLRVVH